MPIPYIPLDEVYRDRKKATVTLKACCLVSESRTFLAPARERLYRTLALEILPSEKDMNAARNYPSRPVTLELSRKQARLLPSLALSPILPTLPRSLSFEIFLDFDTGLGKERYRAEAPQSLLATILSLCPNITSVPLYIDTSVGVSPSS